jgi:amino acid efflux transporter
VAKARMPWWLGAAWYVGAVLGSGILILPGITARVAGPGGLVAWSIMAAFSVPVAFTFAGLAQALPSAGGIAAFADGAFGRTAGALVGWLYVLTAATGQTVVALTGGMYAVAALHGPPVLAYAVALGWLAVAAWVNLRGLRLGGAVQLAVSAAIFGLLLASILVAAPHVAAANLSPLTGRGWRSIGTAAMLIFWSFFGWEAVASLVPELRDPERDVVRATGTAVAVVAALYVGVAVAVVGTRAYADGRDISALVTLFARWVGGGASQPVGALAALIALATSNAFIASVSRLAAHLADTSAAPPWLAARDRRGGTPQNAIGFLAFFAGAGVLADLALHVPLARLVEVPNSLGIATYVIGAASGVRALRAWPYRAAAWVMLAGCLLAYPFVGGWWVLPVVVAAACLADLRGRCRSAT